MTIITSACDNNVSLIMHVYVISEKLLIRWSTYPVHIITTIAHQHSHSCLTWFAETISSPLLYTDVVHQRRIVTFEHCIICIKSLHVDGCPFVFSSP